MRDTLYRMFGSVRLVQEVSRSAAQSAMAPTSTTASLNSNIATPHQSGIGGETPLDVTVPSEIDKSADSSEDSQLHQPEAVPMIPSTPWQLSILFGSYSPAVPSYLPSYAIPGTLPSWLMNLSTPRSVSALNARPRRGQASGGGPYTVRHHGSNKQQQPIEGCISLHALSMPTALVDKKLSMLSIESSAKDKLKSQKLLCLWPLPIITRYVIGISFIVAILNFMELLDLKCSSPTYVIHRLEITNLMLSPFFFTGSFHAFLLFAWNILILGLFEESLAHLLGGTQQFVKVFMGILFSVCMTRQGIGYLFSKSTGFAVPILFFSDSLHECSQGLAPFLFALLVVQSLSINDKYILMYGPDESNQKITIRKFVLQLLMCLVNYAVKNILWWSLTGLLIGYLATIVIQTSLIHQRIQWSNDGIEGIQGKMESPNRRIPLWRSLWLAVKKGAIVVMVTLSVLLLCNAYHSRETPIDPATLNQLTHDRYMFTFIVMTAPRRGEPAFLSQTLESYLENWPMNPEPGTLYDRIHALVYTHFTNHSQFDAARDRFSADVRGQKYLKWVREEGTTFDQRLHVSKALSLAADSFQSTYIALLEDDFPICGRNEWRHIENVVFAANQHVPGHCGVFVGTGGSGLFMKPKIAKRVSGLLHKYTDKPPDIVIQDCLAGLLPECSECKHTMVTSKRLLMYHIGFNTSTSHDRKYKKHDFQCGWRHPFNGDPNVITL
ncbi:hypothetical protein BX666DRAFT_1950322 [Dichotomocladium elegans]|nr:hypothetical protein BX666DRAFT_1950322 [Dichotomocladium elegans]